MALANIAFTDTFDQWRIKTNQLIDAYGRDLLIFNSNTASFKVTNPAGIGETVYFDVYPSQNVLDTVSTNVAGIRVVGNTYILANAAFLQANNVALSANLYSNAVGAAGNTTLLIYSNNMANTVNTTQYIYSNNMANTVNTVHWAYANSMANTVNVVHWMYANGVSNTVNTTQYIYSNNMANTVNTVHWIYANNIANTVNTTQYIYSNNMANTVNTVQYIYSNNMGNTVNSVTRVYANGIANTVNTTLLVYSNNMANTVNTVQYIYSNNSSNTLNTVHYQWANSVGAAGNAWSNTITGTVYALANNTANSVNTLSVIANNAITMSVDNASNTTLYIPFTSVTDNSTGFMSVSNTKLTFNPNTGTVSATHFNSLSDKSLKDQLVIITDSVDKIGQMTGYSFRWKDSGRQSYGVIAQELEAIAPELVDTVNNERKTVNYDGIIAFLIEAVKELDARVKELEKKQ